MSTQAIPLTTKLIRIKNQWVILDRDIAALFEVETKRLLEKCKRNKNKLSAADYFQLSNEEFDALRSQFATIEGRGKHSKYRPFCFTKKGMEKLKILFKKDAQLSAISEVLDSIEIKENEPLFKEPELGNDLVTYTSDDGKVQFDVKFDGNEVWLTQQQLSELYIKNIRTISEHINNIFSENELEEKAAIRKFRITESGGKTYNVLHYNLDVIYSIGYRVKSPRGTQFRQWSNKVLRAHHINGYSIKDRATESQLNHAKHYIDNRVTNYNITVGDISIQMKGNKVSLENTKVESNQLSELIEELEMKVKGTILEPVVQEGKKSTNINEFVQDIIREESWFRKTIDYISDTKETIHKISTLFLG